MRFHLYAKHGFHRKRNIRNFPTVQKLNFLSPGLQAGISNKETLGELNKESFVGIKKESLCFPTEQQWWELPLHEHKHPLGTPRCSQQGTGAAAPSSLRPGAAGTAAIQLLQQTQQQLRALQQGQPLVGSGTKQQGINLLVGFHSCFFLSAAPAKRAENHNSWTLGWPQLCVLQISKDKTWRCLTSLNNLDEFP